MVLSLEVLFDLFQFFPLKIDILLSYILGCLLHWLEQDASCPTCRLQLLQNGPGDGINVQSRTNNGATWSTWNWTVGWSRLLQQTVTAQSAAGAENSQLESLAEQVSCRTKSFDNWTISTKNGTILQVQQMFPDYPLDAVIEDLRRTRSLDTTIENILDGLLQPTLPMFQQEPGPETSFTEIDEEVRASCSEETTKFFECPEQRQNLLQNRKRDLLTTARLRFIQKQSQPNASNH